MSGKKALELGLEVIAKIKGYADAAHVIPDSYISFSYCFLLKHFVLIIWGIDL